MATKVEAALGAEIEKEAEEEMGSPPALTRQRECSEGARWAAREETRPRRCDHDAFACIECMALRDGMGSDPRLRPRSFAATPAPTPPTINQYNTIRSKTDCDNAHGGSDYAACAFGSSGRRLLFGSKLAAMIKKHRADSTPSSSPQGSTYTGPDIHYCKGVCAGVFECPSDKSKKKYACMPPPGTPTGIPSAPAPLPSAVLLHVWPRGSLTAPSLACAGSPSPTEATADPEPHHKEPDQATDQATDQGPNRQEHRQPCGLEGPSASEALEGPEPSGTAKALRGQREQRQQQELQL